MILARFFSAGLAALSALAVAPDADASPEGVAWVRADGAERCPDGAALRERVGARLGRAADPAPNAIEVVATRVDHTWTARIYVRDPYGALVGERSLQAEGDDCEALVSVVSLVVALAIDPDLATRPPPAQPASRAVSAARAQRPRLRSEVSLGAVASIGVLPAIAPGVALDAHLPLSTRWGVALGLRWLPEATSEQGPVAFGWTVLRVGACWAPLAGADGALRVCGDFRAGAIHSVLQRGATLVPDETGQRPWVGAALSLSGTLRVWRSLFVRADLEAQTPFVRDVFVITRLAGVSEVFQPPVVAGAAVLSLDASI